MVLAQGYGQYFGLRVVVLLYRCTHARPCCVLRRDADMAAPVSYLKGKGVHVRSTLTLTRPAMRFAYTDPSLDVDVSELLERTGILEGGITQVVRMWGNSM